MAGEGQGMERGRERDDWIGVGGREGGGRGGVRWVIFKRSSATRPLSFISPFFPVPLLMRFC